jgi:hypothetical protein
MARRHFINYPTNRLLAVVDDPATAEAAVADLVAGGLAQGDVELLAGQRDAARLDGLGGANGRFSRALRSVQFMTMDQMPDFLLYETALRLGRAVVVVRPRSAAERQAAIARLRVAGGHFMNWYGRLATEEISLWRGPEPDIAGIWRR